MQFARHQDHIITARDALHHSSAALTCPRCGLPVQGQISSTGRPYFRHKLAHPTCGTQSETELHFIAKQIIAQAGFITLPEGNKQLLLQLETEKPLSRFYIDLAAFTPDGRRILIELNHRHSVTPEKIAYFVQQGFLALEIDLNASPCPPSIREYILHTAPRKWLTAPGAVQPRDETAQRFAAFTRRRSEWAPFTPQNLEDFLHTLAYRDPDFPATRFTGTVQVQPHYFLKEVIPYCIYAPLGPDLFQHLIGIPKALFPCRKKDVNRGVTFRIRNEPDHFIFCRSKRLPLYLPLARDIVWEDEGL